MHLSVLMTVYNEADFLDYAIRSILPHVVDVVIVEGAYQETIRLGKPPRSSDGTLDIIYKYAHEPNVRTFYTNEESDKDQRNIGLEKIKKTNPNGWLLIIDGDELYKASTFQIIKNTCNLFDKQDIKAAYFKSLTFVNDFNHYCEQSFPRLFKITPDCKFINDNFMQWGNLGWSAPHVTKLHNIQYFHYSFLKGDRFLIKKEWWENRFGNNYNNTGKKFEYDWYMDENGKIYSPNHKIFKFDGNHPDIVMDHPKWHTEHKNTQNKK